MTAKLKYFALAFFALCVSFVMVDRVFAAENIPVTGIHVSPSSAYRKVGSSLSVLASVQPSNATNKNISFSSSNYNVARVDGTGHVRAFSVGQARITATTDEGGFSAFCYITVYDGDDEPEPPSGQKKKVTLSHSLIGMKVGASPYVEAFFDPPLTMWETLSWYTGDEDIASATEYGPGQEKAFITAHKEGETTLYIGIADDSVLYDTVSFPITVSNNPSTTEKTITVSPSPVAMKVGESVRATATVTPALASGETLTATMTDPTLAQLVDSDYKSYIVMKGLKEGQSQATVTVRDATGGTVAKQTTQVIVSNKNTEPPVEPPVEPPITDPRISISPSSSSITAGQRTVLTAKAVPELTNREFIRWESTDLNIAELLYEGGDRMKIAIKGKNIGSATITATIIDANGSVIGKTTHLLTVSNDPSTPNPDPGAPSEPGIDNNSGGGGSCNAGAGIFLFLLVAHALMKKK